MLAKLHINPAGKVQEHMSPEAQARTPVLSGLEVNEDPARVFRILLKISFQAIRLEELLGPGIWYVAANQMSLGLRATGAKITGYTEGTAITATYTVTKSKKKARSGKIKPEIDVAPDTSVSLGEIGVKLEKGEELVARV
jgi:hypothetical protein